MDADLLAEFLVQDSFNPIKKGRLNSRNYAAKQFVNLQQISPRGRKTAAGYATIKEILLISRTRVAIKEEHPLRSELVLRTLMKTVTWRGTLVLRAMKRLLIT